MGSQVNSCIRQAKTYTNPTSARESQAKEKLHIHEDSPANGTSAKRSSLSVDPKKLLFVQERNRLLIRKAGSIQGHDFIIEECQNCRIYILDVTAQVTIDDCQNCSIFLSPCQSSVSIRNCSNCELVSICSQLRIRDCKNLDIMLFCATSPAIETSKDVNFFGYQFAYFSLLKQMDDSNLSVFNNAWSRVHDFDSESPSKFAVKCNSVSTKDVFPFIFSFILKDSIPEEVRNDLFPTEDVVIPLTNGTALNDGELDEDHPECLMWIIADQEEVAANVFQKIMDKVDRASVLVDTKLLDNEDSVMEMVGFEREKIQLKACVCIHMYTAESVAAEADMLSGPGYKVKVCGPWSWTGDKVDLQEIKNRVFGAADNRRVN